MDLERARHLVHELESMEPQKPAEAGTPQERFASIGSRIEKLNYDNNAMRAYSGATFDNGLSVHIRNDYDIFTSGDERPRELFSVRAEWSNKGKRITQEFISIGDLDKPEAGRLLGLIEESVSEVEKIVNPSKATPKTA